MRNWMPFEQRSGRKKLCRPWRNSGELGAVITVSCVSMISSHPAEGWVKARHVKTTEDAEKMTQLLEQVRALEKELAALRRSGAADTSGLAQGDDEVDLEFTTPQDDGTTVHVHGTWNAIFSIVGRACIGSATPGEVQRAFRSLSKAGNTLSPESFEKVKIQLYCLGLIRVVLRVSRSPEPMCQHALSG